MKVYNSATTLLRADGMHFSFNRRLEDCDGAAEAREAALRDLDDYIGVLVTQPEIRARLAEATADFQRTMDEEGLARQQKLRAMDEDLTRRSEEHTSELQSLMRISYAVFCLKKKNKRPKSTVARTQTN